MAGSSILRTDLLIDLLSYAPTTTTHPVVTRLIWLTDIHHQESPTKREGPTGSSPRDLGHVVRDLPRRPEQQAAAHPGLVRVGDEAEGRVPRGARQEAAVHGLLRQVVVARVVRARHDVHRHRRRQLPRQQPMQQASQ